jgi:hypothetical protein
VLHVAISAAVFTLGRNSFLPSTFDTNGIAVSFAGDGVGHREDAATLAQSCTAGEFRMWFSSAYPFHVKLYSICFVVFGPSLGLNILGAEPLNLFYYLGILILVYKLGEEAFETRAGLVAAVTVALWPSLLLHTTQLLKDPLFILAMLALVFVMIRLLTGVYSWRKSLLGGVLGTSLSAVLWKTRPDMAPVLVLTVLLGASALALRQFQLKRILLSNLTAMALLLALTAGVVIWLPVYQDSENPRHPDKPELKQPTVVGKSATARTDLRWWRVGAQVGVVRQRFSTMYPDAGSNIDSNVELTNNEDLVRYLPRAAVLGLFAPFPSAWFERGNSVGYLGRLLGGLETFLMYGVELLAIVGLWRGRRHLSVWLLFSIAAMGTIALGLVVINVGTLYRLRYVFLILLIILAAGGITHAFDWLRQRQSPRLKVDA